MKAQQKPFDFILVDGSSYLFRAYHALPALSNRSGEQTGAVYGVVNMLMKLWNSEKPRYMAVVFDTPSKNFRHELWPAYKANRTEMPEELRAQIAPLFEIIEALGLPLLRFPGFEADDVIASLAVQAKEKKLRTLVSTGDKDLAQLVCEDVTLVNTMSNHYLSTAAAVKEKFGVYPEQIADYLALIGDTVDNIPGVAGVGPKTAAKWLEGGKTLEALMANPAQLTGKVAENFKAVLSELPLYKKLNTVHTDLDLNVNVEDLDPKAKNIPVLTEWFTRFEFKSLLSKLDGETEKTVEPPSNTATKATHYQLIQTEATFLEAMQAIAHKKIVSFDLETTSLNVFEAEVVGFSFAYEADHAFYVPLLHSEPGAKQLDQAWALSQIKVILENEQITKIGHNLKYDINVLKKYDIAFKGPLFDTMLASYVFNSTAGRHDLGSVAQRYLGRDSVSYEDVTGKGAKQINFKEVGLAAACAYAAEDADLTFLLHQYFHLAFDVLPTLRAVYEEIELAVMPVLAEMEYTGILIDVEKLKQHSIELEGKLKILEETAYQVAGECFNLNSPKQLQVILYEKLGIPVTEKTATGQPSTAESVLQELSFEYELPKLIIEYRQLAKLKSTYTDALQEECNPKTGRIHTSFHQANTATGRLSSQNPNLQNIPIRTEEGRRIRQAFIPAKGCIFIAADYEQIELKIMAHVSGDKALVGACQRGDDVHAATAAEIFHVEIDAVSKEQRRFAKVINFGLLYGMSAFGVARNLSISNEEADSYMKRYFDRFSGVKNYIDTTKEMAKEKGFVETIFGRRLYLPDLKAKNRMLQNAALRAAVNAPMQGSAADLIKKAMIKFDQMLAREKLPAKLLLQVHDELVVELKENVAAEVGACLKEAMETAASLKVPLTVGLKQGHNWDEAH